MYEVAGPLHALDSEQSIKLHLTLQCLYSAATPIRLLIHHLGVARLIRVAHCVAGAWMVISRALRFSLHYYSCLQSYIYSELLLTITILIKCVTTPS